MKPGCYRLITHVRAKAENTDGVIPELRSGVADGVYVNSKGTWLGVVVTASEGGPAEGAGQAFSILPYWNDNGDYIPAGSAQIGEYLGEF